MFSDIKLIKKLFCSRHTGAARGRDVALHQGGPLPRPEVAACCQEHRQLSPQDAPRVAARCQHPPHPRQEHACAVNKNPFGLKKNHPLV